MTTRDFLDKVCSALQRESGSLALTDTPESVEEWDSLGHLSIISTVDTVVGVGADDEELRSFKSLGQLVAALRRRRVLED